MDFELRKLQRIVASDPSPNNLTNYVFALSQILDYSTMNEVLDKHTSWELLEIIERAVHHSEVNLRCAACPEHSLSRLWYDLVNSEPFWRMRRRHFNEKPPGIYLSFMGEGGYDDPQNLPVLALFFETRDHPSIQTVMEARVQLATALNLEADLQAYRGISEWISSPPSGGSEDTSFVCVEHQVDRELLLKLFTPN